MTFCLVWAPDTFYSHNKREEKRENFRVNILVANWVVLKLGVFRLVFSLGKHTT